ncbi:hypothetical protein [Segetibacter aerophilus]|uniref:Gram-positive cocci surface proteins LPxTG domain-containing protein n=1 Tax=Segetibacter aerophilus TaxID=670293 RepID=A0A512BEH5_9BACT|nr:hypothetical protein [Segetibacter aerophilus]GEO10358.1 hypothetical protein SAE01_28540 [Segetibacter aerophilus]
MNKISKRFFLFLTILLINVPTSIYAQPPIDNDNVEDNPVPLDSGSGISLLVAAAIFYGLKKARQQKQPETI